MTLVQKVKYSFMRLTVVLAVYLSTVIFGFGEDVNLLSFYTVDYSVVSPMIDGNLDDSCWETAAIYSTYYVYFKTVPEPGALKTELRMLWNEKGLYLGVINYDEHVESIRTKHTIRDDDQLWLDDCAELYFDPLGNGVGFTKFAINALGVVADMRRIDASVSLPEWSASGAEITASKGEKAWFIEAFFPWNDLDAIVHSGDIWRFCHVRYAWSSGKFVGVSSSLGGSYARTDNFGFIYFVKNKKLDIKEIGGVLRKVAVQPWNMLINNGLLECRDDKLDFLKLNDLYAANYRTSQKLLRQIKGISVGLSNAVPIELEQQLEQLRVSESMDISMVKLRMIRGVIAELDELYWKQKTDNLLKDE